MAAAAAATELGYTSGETMVATGRQLASHLGLPGATGTGSGRVGGVAAGVSLPQRQTAAAGVEIPRVSHTILQYTRGKSLKPAPPPPPQLQRTSPDEAVLAELRQKLTATPPGPSSTTNLHRNSADATSVDVNSNQLKAKTSAAASRLKDSLGYPGQYQNISVGQVHSASEDLDKPPPLKPRKPRVGLQPSEELEENIDMYTDIKVLTTEVAAWRDSYESIDGAANRLSPLSPGDVTPPSTTYELVEANAGNITINDEGNVYEDTLSATQGSSDIYSTVVKKPKGKKPLSSLPMSKKPAASVDRHQHQQGRHQLPSPPLSPTSPPHSPISPSSTESLPPPPVPKKTKASKHDFDEVETKTGSVFDKAFSKLRLRKPDHTNITAGMVATHHSGSTGKTLVEIDFPTRSGGVRGPRLIPDHF